MVLVRGIEDDPVRQSLVTGLRHFVREMGGVMIAEGVEREAEADTLVRLGLDDGQGYPFGRPAPVERWAAGAGRAATAPTYTESSSRSPRPSAARAAARRATGTRKGEHET